MASDSMLKEGKYNIVTVVTFDYFPFFLSFLGSFFSNVNVQHVASVYVVVDELPDEFVDYLKQFEIIKIIAKAERVCFSGTHFDGWRKAVSWKLAACRQILQENPLPLFLLDSDILFVGDISDFVATDHDLLVTYMSNPLERHVRKDGLKINYIASAVLFGKAESSIRFIDAWIEKQDYVRTNFAPPHETPALNLLLEECVESDLFSIGVMQDAHISADQAVYEGTRVIHLKTWGSSKFLPIANYYGRISRNAWSADQFAGNYLDALCFERWLMYQLNYVSSHHAAGNACVAFCDGGLANRVNSLIVPLYFKAKFGGDWLLNWPVNQWCGAEFDLLFSLDWKRLELPLSEFSKQQENFLMITHQNFAAFEPENIIYSNSLRTMTDYDHAYTNRSRALIYNGNLIPQAFSVSDVALALSGLKINPDVWRVANAFCVENRIDDSVFGLHIRKTDFGDVVDDASLYSMVENHSARFFVCTDDAGVHEKFSRLDNCLVFEKAAYPEKLIPDAEWQSGVEFTSGHVGLNINRSASAMVEALVDLLILSRTTLVDCESGSTFFSLAKVFKATRFF